MIATINRDDIFFSGLNDEVFERSWEEARADTRIVRRKAFMKKIPFLTVALLVMALVPIGIVWDNERNNKTYIAFENKIAAAGNTIIWDSLYNYAYVRIGNHVAQYERLPFESEELTPFIGDFYTEGPNSSDPLVLGVLSAIQEEDCLNTCDCSWFRLKGVRNLKYLLRKDSEGNLTAWRFGLFMSFQEGSWRKLFPENVEKEAEYGYQERLEVLCQASDAKDVVRIEVLPSGASFAALSMPTSELEVQVGEIGTKTIKERRTITEILDILKGMKDVPNTGEDNLKHLHIFRSERVKDIVESCYLAGELGPVTRYERSVRLVFSDGSSDLLSYTAVSGAFSYYKQKCIELNDEEMLRINTLFGIDTEWTLPDEFGKAEMTDDKEPAGTPSDIWSDYDAGCYETPAGTVVICVKHGGEAYADEITAYNLKTSYNNSSMPVKVRYVKYNRSEQISTVNVLAKQMRDRDSSTGYKYGISAFGVSEIYNKVNIYLYDFNEENIAAILAAVGDSDMIQFVRNYYTWTLDD